MIDQDICFKAIRRALSRGGDYCDVFVEERTDTGISLDDGRIKGLTTGTSAGVGLRVIVGRNYLYMYAGNPTGEKLMELAEQMAGAVAQDEAGNLGEPFSPEGRGLNPIRTDPDNVDLCEKVELLKRADTAARNYSSKIAEAMVQYSDYSQKVWIAGSDGRFVTDERVRTRFAVSSISQDGDKKETGMYGPGRAMGWEFFDLFSPEQVAEEASRIAVLMLDADYAPQGKMPVIIDNEFGGVIFHEACGHALEATSVADDASVFSGKMGEKIASDVVNAVDDGTIPNAWGSADFDDEGEPTQRIQLIRDGELTSYMIDRLGSMKMNMPGTASGRRQSYKFAPTSRMTNTFITAGPYSRDDLIATIDEGLLCVNMGGGSVNPPTTDFNFSVREAYLIKDGKVDRPVKGASLIGKGSEIIKKIEMVADNLDYNGTGMCGSISGSVPAGVGQPSVKVSGLVVGGRNQ
jgi:TldD protein